MKMMTPVYKPPAIRMRSFSYFSANWILPSLLFVLFNAPDSSYLWSCKAVLIVWSSSWSTWAVDSVWCTVQDKVCCTRERDELTCLASSTTLEVSVIVKATFKPNFCQDLTNFNNKKSRLPKWQNRCTKTPNLRVITRTSHSQNSHVLELHSRRHLPSDSQPRYKRR